MENKLYSYQFILYVVCTGLILMKNLNWVNLNWILWDVKWNFIFNRPYVKLLFSKETFTIFNFVFLIFVYKLKIWIAVLLWFIRSWFYWTKFWTALKTACCFQMNIRDDNIILFFQIAFPSCMKMVLPTKKRDETNCKKKSLDPFCLCYLRSLLNNPLCPFKLDLYLWSITFLSK